MAGWFPLVLAAAVAAQAASSTPAQPTRLFADSAPIGLTLRGPISALAKAPPESRAPHGATLVLASPAAETHPILLSPRGKSRRQREACDFPPLRVEFRSRPPATSLFERQRRLKLVTHCRRQAGFQQHLLLEYSAYRMFNAVSPAGLRVRLASIDYVDQNGRPFISRLGFFTEDPDDAARRNGMVEFSTTGRIASSQLDPLHAARAALFEYMIGNLDWSMRAAPVGDNCCHNFRFLAPRAGGGGLVPVPYDFDASGLVNTPYALPPEGLPVSSVRQRRYRGYCSHNAQALAAAAEYRSKRGPILGALAEVPGIDEGRRRAAAAYVERFFSDIATDEEVRRRLLRTCIG